MTCATLTIYVRYASGTYRARCNGHTATCTAGEEHAARVVAAKAAKSMKSLGIISRPAKEFPLTKVMYGCYQTEAGLEIPKAEEAK